MRAFVTLLRNVLVALGVTIKNILRLLGLRASTPEWVRFHLEGDPPYLPSPWTQRAAAAISGRKLPLDLRTLARRFDAMTGASELKGVLLRVDGLTSSMAKIGAVADLVKKLRNAGKEVHLWTPHATSREAPLLFAGNRLFMPPGGRLDLRGFAVETVAAASALNWAGLDVTVIRRGRYKTAAEPLTNEEPSPELRETLDSILDDLQDSLLDALAQGRGLGRDEAAGLVDRGPWGSQQALAAGLLDGLCYWDDLAGTVTGASDQGNEAPTEPNVGEGRATTEGPNEHTEDRESEGAGKKARADRVSSWPEFRASQPSKLDWKPVFIGRRAIALVPIRGLIVEGETRQILGGSVAGHRTVEEALSVTANLNWVHGVVLLVDSRGGSAIASDLIWREVRRLAEKKPVVAYIDTVAASGGYYCASAAKEIVAAPLALTGSIGVISVILEASRLTGRLGINRRIIQRGENAAMGTTARKPTASEIDSLENEAECFYELFIERVSKGRPLSKEEVAQRAEGRVFTGSTAEAHSLVDHTGGLEVAVERACSLTGIPYDHDVPLVTIAHTGGLFGGGIHVGGAKSSHFLRPLNTSDLGLDPFDLAWLGACAAQPAATWAVMPHRLIR